MGVPGRPPLLAPGRILAVVAIVLCAFSLRSAVASFSPVAVYIAADFPLSSAVIGLIGAAPPACYALAGLFTPALGRRLGLEATMTIAVIAMTVGLLLRVLVSDGIALLGLTALLFAGVGMGNVLLPPLVKKHFPDHLGIMMTVYVTTMGLSTFVPPLIAVPVADLAGWRVSLGMWGVFAAVALVPWVMLVVRERARPPAPAEELLTTGPLTVPVTDTGSVSVTEAIRVSRRHGAGPAVTARLFRMPLAWALVMVFIVSAATTYTAFVWLPPLLMDIAGIDTAAAGALLSLMVLMGLPAGVIVPTLVVRFQATRAIFFVSVSLGIVGWLGLLFAPLPALLPLWVIGLGVTGGVFPLSVVLLSIRARTPESAVALSGFVQGIGYGVTAVFPVLIGLLHDAAGTWVVPMIVLLAVLVVSLPAGWAAGRRTTVEEEWVRRHGSW